MVDQLVEAESGSLTWQPMLVEGLTTVNNPSKPRFLVFMSGIGIKYTFLMDSAVGTTWIPTLIELEVADAETVTVPGWVPFPE